MPWDARATRTAVADGWIGLAADRVGVADASGAARVLTTVRPRDVRDDIRRSWVSCEIALLQGTVGRPLVTPNGHCDCPSGGVRATRSRVASSWQRPCACVSRSGQCG